TRDDLRALVRRALEVTHGSYKSVARLFNLPESDYKRLLNFLRKYDCHLPIQDFRPVTVQLPRAESRPTADEKVSSTPRPVGIICTVAQPACPLCGDATQVILLSTLEKGQHRV